MAQHARLNMVRKQIDAELVKRRAHGRDLRENINTVTIFLNHFLNAGDLARNAIQPRKRRLFA